MVLNRVNTHGLNYFLIDEGDGKTQIRFVARVDPQNPVVKSVVKSIVVNVAQDALDTAWFNWVHKGMLIQQAFPMLSAPEREFLMTGITPEEWKTMFPPMDEDEGTEDERC